MGRKEFCVAVVLVLGLAGGAVFGDITSQLVGYWPLDGDATDASGNGLHGTVNGNVAPAADRYAYASSAMVFAGGGSDNIDVGDPPELQMAGEMTLAAWVYLDSTSALHGARNARVISKMDGGGRRSWSMNIEMNVDGVPFPGTFQISSNGNDVISLNDTETLPLDQWLHMVAVYRPGQAMELYLNGQLKVSNTTDIPGSQHSANSTSVFIGHRPACGNCGWYGSLDEVRAYERALSADDIKELFEFVPVPRLQAWEPEPADGAIGVTTPLLQWEAGVTATIHRVYVGTSPELSEADLAGPPMPLAMLWYTAGLEPGATYYWRVDEVEFDMTTVHTGELWSFTAAPATAWTPAPADGAQFIHPQDLELTWAAGMNALSHEVYFGEDADEVANGTGDTFKGEVMAAPFAPGELENGKTYYWRVDEIGAGDARVTGELWSFSTIPDVPVTDASLLGWWTLDEGEGKTAVDWSGHGHHGAVLGEPPWVEGVDGGALDLEYGNTNDGVSAEAFDVAGGAITLAAWVRPESFSQNDGRIITKASGTSTNDHLWMLSTVASGSDYVLRFRLKTDDGQDTATLVASSGALTTGEWAHAAATWDGAAMVIYKDGVEVGRGAKGGAAVATNPGLKISIGNHFSGTTGARPWDGLIDDVRVYDKALTADELAEAMRGNPLVAWDPEPAHNATVDIESVTALRWNAGDNAVEHDVYLGDDKDAVKDADASDATGIYRGRQTTTTYGPPEGFAWGTSYFWRIDEVAADGTVSTGRIWNFTVADYLIVDDFESYTNEVGQRVFEVWVDGFGFTQPEPGNPGNGSGATVGHDIWTEGGPHFEGTLMEVGDVHGGGQAMPLAYDNSAAVMISETTRTWAAPQNWTTQGVEVLRTWYKGRNPPGSLSYDATAGIYTMTGAGSNIWGGADQFHFAPKELTGNGSITLRVDNIVPSTHGDPRIGVMIRDTLDPGAANATLFVEPDPRTRLTQRLHLGEDTTTVVLTEVGETPLPTWIRLSRQGFTFKAERSSDGATWRALTDDAGASSANIAMTDPVYIGLVVCSHVAGQFAEATYSNVSTTGNVTPDGPFTASQDIGIASNAPQPLYMALEDTAGRIAFVDHPDGPDAVAVNAWRPWDIELSDFADINLAGIKAMIIGVGDHQTPQIGGKGLLLIDDVQLRQP